MRTILFIIQKEFLQVFRNKTMLPIIFAVPIVQLLILVNAATFEIKNINISIVDFDHSTKSRELIQHFEASPFYTIIPTLQSVNEAEKLIHANKSDIVLVIPNDFEKDIQLNRKPNIQLLVNAINGASAGLVNAYTSNIVNRFSANLMVSNLPVGFFLPSTIETNLLFWYNPELQYSHFMVPGILVILVTLVSMFLTALNLVREKEIGTIEQINVTPIHKYQFIMGKLIPYWIIGLFELAFGLLIGWLLFNIPMEGNLVMLFGFAAIYLVVTLSAGLLISSMASTQQQVMFTTFFFMIIFILMSGIFTPTESMPIWAKVFNQINPLYYFIKVNRMVLIKGSNIKDILPFLLPIIGLALSVFSLAIYKYRKTS